jgi:hypothetical protein
MRTRWLFFLAVLVIVGGVGLAINRGAGPLPDPEACAANVANHRVELSTDQAQNATLISAIAVRRGLPARAASIALATAFQESKLTNLTSGDRDSIGLFQQRPSQGWGTPAQIRNPTYAINKFYDALAKVHGYQGMAITVAAQKVQRSAFPDAYQAHEPDARALASALTGYSLGGRFACVVHTSTQRGTARHVEAALTAAYGDLGPARTGTRQDVGVPMPAGTPGLRLGWSVAQFVDAHAKELHVTRITFDHKQWRVGSPSESGWTKDASAGRGRVLIQLG